MTWIEKIRAWNKLMKYIRQNRQSGRSSFEVLTTGNELIIYDEHREDETLRIDCNLN